MGGEERGGEGEGMGEERGHGIGGGGEGIMISLPTVGLL